jgi:hypothetical protein
MDRESPRSESEPGAAEGALAPGRAALASEAPRRIEGLPKEVGALLMVAGLTTGMLPLPPGPFDLSLVVAGGFVLWPRGLGGVESWTRRRFPKAHRCGMKFLDRYLTDLERRYPVPIKERGPRRDPGSGPPARPPG